MKNEYKYPARENNYRGNNMSAGQKLSRFKSNEKATWFADVLFSVTLVISVSMFIALANQY